MIFTRHGLRWMVDDRGFIYIPGNDEESKWIMYGWLDLI